MCDFRLLTLLIFIVSTIPKDFVSKPVGMCCMASGDPSIRRAPPSSSPGVGEHSGDARFDEEVVGPDGAGYRWDVRDAAHQHYSIALPPPDNLEEEADADSDDDRSITTAAELVRPLRYR